MPSVTLVEPTLIDAPHDREPSRLACVYSLVSGRVPGKALKGLERPVDHFELGRFRDHFEEEAENAWFMHKALEFVDAALATCRGTFVSGVSGYVYAVFDPSGGATVLLVVDFDEDLKAAVSVLQETCFRRDQLTINGKRLVDVLRDGLPACVAEPLAPERLGRDVHQLLLVGTGLATKLPVTEENADRRYDPSGFMRLVYREDRDFRSGPEHTSMRQPVELNRPFGTLCAHGRGVTVLVGAAEHVEAGVVITAIELVTALGQLRRIRREAVQSMTTARDLGRRADGPGEVRAELGRLTGKLGNLAVKLSFDVDAYLDALRFPEIVLQSYRESLAATLGIAEGATLTADMLGRLENVLKTRREELAAVEDRQAAIRRKRST